MLCTGGSAVQAEGDTTGWPAVHVNSDNKHACVGLGVGGGALTADLLTSRTAADRHMTYKLEITTAYNISLCNDYLLYL